MAIKQGIWRMPFCYSIKTELAAENAGMNYFDYISALMPQTRTNSFCKTTKQLKFYIYEGF